MVRSRRGGYIFHYQVNIHACVLFELLLTMCCLNMYHTWFNICNLFFFSVTGTQCDMLKYENIYLTSVFRRDGMMSIHCALSDVFLLFITDVISIMRCVLGELK